MSRHPLKSQTIQTGAALGLVALVPIGLQIHDHGIRSLSELQWGQVSAASLLLWGNIQGRFKAGGLTSWLPHRRKSYRLTLEEQRQSYRELRRENQQLRTELAYAHQAMGKPKQPPIHTVPVPEAQEET